ncbi:hypothetical protein ABZ896_20790 [Streptomyces sp. NPDC047072]|uniref:hypothetical protein n=1 Tax=Streptomyces sp. NPDC047072 TaxID=3154809 RepID=UPI0033C17071
MTSFDARPSGCTPFEEELMNAMQNYADTADAPAFDAPGIVRRTRRRRTAGIAAVAAVLVLAGTGTALASMNGGGEGVRGTVASSGAPRSGKDTVVVVGKPGDSFTIDFAGLDLVLAKELLAKARLELGTVGKAAPEGCKPGSVVAAAPHSPTLVPLGGTVDLTLCAR